jgi:hypothetical protein
MNQSEIIIPELEEAPDFPMRKAWLPEEEAIVIKYFDKKDPALIAKVINERFHTNRTVNAVRQKAGYLKNAGRMP